MGLYGRALNIVIRMFLARRSAGKQSQMMLNGRPVIRVLPDHGRPRATLMAIHGMTALGNTDPRIQVLGSAFAANGYEVILPLYHDIQQLIIDSGSIQSMEEDLLTLSSLRGPVGVFSASFSGSLGMVAASGKARDAVRCMLLVGPFGHVMSVVEHLFDAEDRDPYGFYVVLKNFLPGKGRRVEALKRCFAEAALDSGLARQPAALPSVLAEVSHPVRREFYRIQHDDVYRRKIKDQILNDRKIQRIARSIDVIQHCPDIRAAVSLIHGDRDNVIPPGESRLLFDHLRDHTSARVCLTPLLTHGHVRYGPDIPLRVHEVVSGVSFFLRHMEA